MRWFESFLFLPLSNDFVHCQSEIRLIDQGDQNLNWGRVDSLKKKNVKKKKKIEIHVQLCFSFLQERVHCCQLRLCQYCIHFTWTFRSKKRFFAKGNRVKGSIEASKSWYLFDYLNTFTESWFWVSTST